MTRALLARLGAAGVACWIVLTSVFFLLRLLPGEPGAIYEDPRVPAEQRTRIRELYGLDRPLGEQYVRWLGGVVRGEWGYSLTQHRPVGRILGEAVPKTLLLSTAALGVELVLGLLLGLAAAARAGSAVDRAIRVVSLALWSLPTFWFGLMLLALFAVIWPLFPPGSFRSVAPASPGSLYGAVDILWHLALPAAAIGIPAAAATARFVRATVLEQLATPFAQSARARGLGRVRVLWNHALRPGLAPIAQLVGLSLAALLSGTLAIEVVFALPGVGRTTFDALVARDYPLLLAGTALSAAFVVAGSFLAEAAQAWFDPRCRDV